MKKVLYWFILLLLCSSYTGRPPIRAGKDIAVFFAVTTYQNSKLGNLQNPIKNAREIANILKYRFGFEPQIIENPTRDQIKNKINELFRLYARNEDGKHPSDGQLLLYFSGHGMSEDENGYFLPADADPSDPSDKGIAYEIWRPKINKINCRHILVAIDACYSVRFDPAWINKPDGEFKRPGEMTDTQRALGNYESYKARVFYTSDNKENQTPDRSNFAKKMLEGLREAKTTGGFVTSKQLFANFVEGASPTPRAGTFGDDEPSSAFLFFDVNGTSISSTLSIEHEADDRAFEKAQSRNTPESYQDYLDIFPNGRHKDEVSQKLKMTPKATPPSGIPDDGLVKVAGGTFMMGCTSEQQDCYDNEYPSHNVTINDFYIGRYEVTQKLWIQVMGSNPSVFKNCNDCPVENVSWEDVQVFLKKLNQQTGKQYRLPTEAEWEYAARSGGKATLFGNGKNTIAPKEINFDTNKSYKKSYSLGGINRQKTAPVGSLNSPNALGLHDMSGNVWEWCRDWYDEYSSKSQSNPVGPSTGSVRVMRGGSWGNGPQNCRVSYRSGYAPGYRYSTMGFRLARTK